MSKFAGIPYRDPAPGPLKKLAAFVAGTFLLVLGLMFSVVLLGILIVAGLALWGYLWWKTRELRRIMREHAAAAPTGGTGNVIDGEAVVVAESGEAGMEVMTTAQPGFEEAGPPPSPAAGRFRRCTPAP